MAAPIAVQKSALQECISKYNRGIECKYEDDMQASGIWNSTVSLVSVIDGTVQLSASGQSLRKRDAQCAAAAAVMALPDFRALMPGWGPPAATGGQSAAGTFDPSWNYKNHLQEVTQQLFRDLELPSYDTTSHGLPHARLFTGTVTLTLPSRRAPEGQVASTTAGSPQLTKRQAEQAAAAAALSSQDLQDAMQAMSGFRRHVYRFLPGAA